MRLKDKVVIVTGGGSGIGEGICLCMAKEGADIVVSDISMAVAEKVAARVQEMDRKALAIQTDVRKAEQCERLIKKGLEAMGRIDVLVCCAGVPGYSATTITEKTSRIEHISENDWNLTIDTNLKGVFLCIRAVAPYFKQEKKGKIINISSIAGRRGADWIPHYSASKAGVIVLGQAVAVQLAPYNVNVNTICPGYVMTPMWDTASKIMSKIYPVFKDMNADEIFEKVISTRVPLGRPQIPESIGHAAVFLASAEADDITGQALNVDGGVVFN
jgi:meso-butanediol dehydrogenase/(S,S)-butanediol dehydrogenase/diacetyl reductase